MLARATRGGHIRYELRTDSIRASYLANDQPFKLLGITYLVEKIKFRLFFQGPLAK